MLFKVPDFGAAAGHVNQLAGDVKLTTTSLEAMGVASSKVTSAQLSGLKMTSTEYKRAQGQIAGLSVSMNIGSDALTKSFVAAHQAGIEFNEMGFSGLEEFQKVMEVTGTDGAKFAASMGKMKLKMAKDPALFKRMTGEIFALGKANNIGREALSGMATTIDILDANMTKLPDTWDENGVSMGQFLKGTTAVAAAFTAMGMTADEAMKASQGLTETLVGNNEGLAEMYTGLANDFPEASAFMVQHLGNADEAFKLLAKSPDEFMLRMGEVVNKIETLKPPDAHSLDRYRLGFAKTFGPASLKMMEKGGFAKMKPILEKAQDPMDAQGVALKNLAGKYQDGRTMAERFALAQDRVQTSLKQVHGVMGDSQYLNAYNKQSKDFLKTVNHLADKGGALGKLTTSMIEIKNHGFGGFLASRSSFGFALSEAIGMIQPMLQYLPMLKTALSALVSPIGLVVAAFAVLADLGRGKDSFVKPFIDNIVKQAPVFFEKAKEVFKQVFSAVFDVLKSIDWGKVGQSIIDGLVWAFNGIVKVIDMIDWGKVEQFLGKAIAAVIVFAFDLAFKAVDLLGKMLDWIAGLDWSSIGNVLGRVFTGIVAVAVDVIVTVIKRIPELILAFVKLGVGILSGIEDALKNAFPRMATAIGVFFTTLKVVAIPILAAVAAHFTVVAARAVYSAMTSAAAWVKSAYIHVAASMRMIAANALYYTTVIAQNIQIAASWARGAVAAVAASVRTVGAYLAMQAASMATGIKMAAAWVIGLGPIAWIVAAVIGLGVVIYKFGDDIKAFFSRLWEGIKDVASAIWDKIKYVILAPYYAIKAIWGLVGGFFSGLWDKIKDAAGWVWDKIKGVVLAPYYAIRAVWEKIKGFFSGIWDAIKSAAGWVWDKIKGIVMAPINAIKSAWGTVTGFFGGIWDSIKGAASSAWDKIKSTASSAWSGLKNVFTGGGGLSAVVKKQLDDAQTHANATSKATVDAAKAMAASVKSTAIDVKLTATDAAGKASTATVDANAKTSKMVGDYVASTEKHLKKAGDLMFPKITGDAMTEAVFAYRQTVNAIDDLNEQMTDKNKDEIHQQQDELRKQMAGQALEIRKLYGVNADVLEGSMYDTRHLFADVRQLTSKMSADERDAFQKKIDATTSYYAGQEVAITRQIMLGQQLNQDVSAYEAKLVEVRKGRDADIVSMTAEIDKIQSITAGSVVKWGSLSREDINLTAKVMVDKFSNASTAMASEWKASGPAGQAIADGFAALDKGLTAAVLDLRVHSNKSGAALQKDIDAVTAKYTEQRSILQKEIGAYASDLRSANANVQAVVADSISATNDKIAASLKLTSDNAQKSAGILAQEFKMSAPDAADAVSKIAVIDAATFRSNIRVVKNEMIKFLEAMDAEAKVMVKDIDKSINKFWEDSKKGWNDQEALIKTYTEKASVHVATYWTKVIDEATKATGAFTRLFGAIQSNLMSMAKSVNVMDLLASPSQISQWAASVVSALGYAFKNGGAVDALITTSYQKALEANSQLQAGNSATPDTSSTASPALPATSAQGALLNTINRPTWAGPDGDIPKSLAKMNERLKEAVEQLHVIARTKPTKPSGGSISGT